MPAALPVRDPFDEPNLTDRYEPPGGATRWTIPAVQNQAMDIQEINRRTIAQFREGGEITGMQRDRLVLLTTTGRRSGQRRTTPLMFHRTGDRVLVIASNIGAPRHPDWYLNLVAEPRVTVEIGDQTYDATATTIDGDERAPVWATLKESYPFFAEHEAATDRTIPVVALIRSSR